MTDLAFLGAGLSIGLTLGTVVMVGLVAFGALVVRDTLAVFGVRSSQERYK